MLYKDKTFWLFITHEDHSFQTNILDRTFKNEWLEISPDGVIKIIGSDNPETGKGGYAWDGCSPKFGFLDLVIGTPDGVVDEQSEKPKTYFASMVHDALYQFGNETGVSRAEADQLFREMLKEKNFKLWYIYYFAVRSLGSLFFGKDSMVRKRYSHLNVFQDES